MPHFPARIEKKWIIICAMHHFLMTDDHFHFPE